MNSTEQYIEKFYEEHLKDDQNRLWEEHYVATRKLLLLISPLFIAMGFFMILFSFTIDPAYKDGTETILILTVFFFGVGVLLALYRWRFPIHNDPKAWFLRQLRLEKKDYHRGLYLGFYILFIVLDPRITFGLSVGGTIVLSLSLFVVLILVFFQIYMEKNFVTLDRMRWDYLCILFLVSLPLLMYGMFLPSTVALLLLAVVVFFYYRLSIYKILITSSGFRFRKLFSLKSEWIEWSRVTRVKLQREILGGGDQEPEILTQVNILVAERDSPVKFHFGINRPTAMELHLKRFLEFMADIDQGSD